jgi:hypothetical protein
MSTTAGLATQEYVAINGTSIVAAIFGVASMLAMFSHILLAIPLISLTCSVAAFRQIRRSNGTQGGTSLVVLAVITALGFSSLFVAREVIQEIRMAPEKKKIIEVLGNFSDVVTAGKFDEAYGMFTVGFKKQGRDRDPLAFNLRLKLLLDHPAQGRLKSLQQRGRIQVEGVDETLMTGWAMMLARYDKAEQWLPVLLKKSNGTWAIHEMETLFPPPEDKPTANAPK